MLTCETVKGPIDECPCDGCGGPLRVGDEAHIDLTSGAAYCGPACAERDPFGREVAVRRPDFP